MNLTPYVAVWAVLAVVVIGLAIFRSVASLHEDDNLHLADSEQKQIPEQQAYFKWMDKIDQWGKSLTVITVGMGLVLASMYLYSKLA